MLNVKEFNLQSNIALRAIASTVEDKNSEIIKCIAEGIKAEIDLLDLRNLSENDIRTLALRCDVFFGLENRHLGGVLVSIVKEHIIKRKNNQEKRIAEILENAEQAVAYAVEDGYEAKEAALYELQTGLSVYDSVSTEIAEQIFAEKYNISNWDEESA